MKTIYVTGNDMEIINTLPSKVRNGSFSKFLEVVGEEEFSPDVLTNCSYSQPDFLLIDFISKEDAILFFESCPSSNIILLNSDSNRSNSIVSELNKEGFYNITPLNKETVTPNQLCELLVNFEGNLETPTPIKEEVVEEKTATTTKKEDDDVISQSDFKQMLEEEKNPENIEKREEEIKKINEERKLEKEFEEKHGMDISSVNFNAMNFSNPTSKVISIYSKRGGTGRSTVAKELGNIFSSIQLPKKLANNSKNLSVCLLDLDFERGNLKTYLGVTNPVPNVYMWINDILDKIESGEKIENIYYPKMSVLQNYTMQIGNYLRFCPTDQGEVPVRIISRLLEIDDKFDFKGTLFPKVIKTIIRALKKSFDIIIIDNNDNFDDITISALENSDEIVYTMLPSLADVENFKVFNDDIKDLQKIQPQKIKLVLNQYIKKVKFVNEIDDVLRMVTYENYNLETSKKEVIPYKLNLKLPFSTNVFNFNNSLMTTFYVTTNGTGIEKQAFLNLASALMPMLKIKNNTQLLNAYKKKEADKKALADKKKETAKIQNGQNKPQENKDGTKVQIKQPEPPKMAFNEFMVSDLSKVTYENFIKTLQSYEQVKKINNGFPYLDAKPKNINSKVWKTYQKNLKVEIKNAMKKKKK
jgi:cellulose biosynthesis protein BcsQ